MQKGETGTFSAKTDIGNTCRGGIGYRDELGKWTTAMWSELMADETGLCKWTWTAPLRASGGTAEFRVATERQGEFRMLIPQTFCIEKCP